MAASTSTAPSASSSSTVAHSNNYPWFAVFINHRGVDVKKSFAKSLYNNLRSIGFRAFLDEHELQRGFNFPSQIKDAIGTASAHVAILSHRYAESIWCLKELVMMLDSKAPIIPVFYGVSPAEVRWTRGENGKYAQSLRKLAEKKTNEGKPRYESSTIENWRNALSHVADISGFELQASDIGEEVELELLDQLVKRLSEMLEKPDLPVAVHPTGLDDMVKHFEDTVQKSGKPQISGIVGLGGVGKTTFAKHFFNRKKSDYHKSCFLGDVRDNASKGSLNSLQIKLLRDLTDMDKPIDNVDEGIGLLKKHLQSSKASFQRKLHNVCHGSKYNPIDSVDDSVCVVSNALIVLDDVDNMNQMDSLLPVDLPSGSLILITCRDKDVLRSPRVEKSSIYMLTGLNKKHSRELFCSYAFSQPCPAPGFEYLVADFLKACNGLPLSLKVFGALLYGRDISDWEDELGSLQQIPQAEINRTFMISYNSLNNEEKQIFLDIACLVEVGSWNQIHMHDRVRDLRIDLAEDSCPRRVWRWTKDVLHNKLLSEPEIPVRGIRMVNGNHNGDDRDDVFDLLDYEIDRLKRIFRRLRILDTENALLERILREVKLPDLIWLRWENCPHSSLPSWVPLKNLRFLQVSKSLLNILWQREGEAQGSLQLPVCLEELCAAECVNLKSIQGLEQLRKLRMLNVSGCSKLEELPGMETLIYLEELRAERCVKLNSIRGLASLTKIQYLHISGCSELEELPGMKSLSVLQAEGCVKLKSIRGLAQCTKLSVLIVDGCSELEELPSTETFTSLKVLATVRCVKLKTILGLAQCTELRALIVRGCSELEELPSMERLVYLEVLAAEGCVKLKSLSGLAECTKLRYLHVGDHTPAQIWIQMPFGVVKINIQYK